MAPLPVSLSLAKWRERPPMFLEARASVSFITFAVSMAVLVDIATYGLVVPIVPFRLMDLGYSSIPSKVSYLVASYGLGLIACSFPVAVLSDRWKSRRTLLVLGLVFLMAGLVLFWQSASYAVMIVARVLQGISGTVVWTLGLALICDQVPPQRRGSAMGFILLSYSVGATLGPTLGGVLYAKQGYNAPFIFALAFAFADIVLRLLIIEQKEADHWRSRKAGVPPAVSVTPPAGSVAGPSVTAAELADPERSPGSDKRTPEMADEDASAAPAASKEPQPAPAWSAILKMARVPRAVTAMGMIALFGFFSGGVLDTAQTIMLNARYGLDSEGAGLVFLAAIIPSFVSSPASGYLTDRIGPMWPAAVTLVLGGAVFGLTMISTSLPVYIVFLAGAGFFLAATNPPVMTDLSTLTSSIPGLGFGAIYALFNLFFSLGATVGPFASGALLNAEGPEVGWKISVAICVGLSIVLAVPAALFLGDPRTGGRISRFLKQRRGATTDEAGQVELDSF